MGFNPAERELCPDGACIGLIGPNGRCKECGTISPSMTQHPRHRGMRFEHEDEIEEELEEKRIVGATETAPPDFDDRVLCTDGTCIGVIGDAGLCKICGAVGPTSST